MNNDSRAGSGFTLQVKVVRNQILRAIKTPALASDLVFENDAKIGIAVADHVEALNLEFEVRPKSLLVAL